jgi:acyl-CoA synthetase (AMP-forming)/AMP-acid ligase II
MAVCHPGRFGAKFTVGSRIQVPAEPVHVRFRRALPMRRLATTMWRTGDVEKLDADGNLFVLDRLKDMISRGGLKVSGAEVESALMQNERIRECAIVGVPDEVSHSSWPRANR